MVQLCTFAAPGQDTVTLKVTIIGKGAVTGSASLTGTPTQTINFTESGSVSIVKGQEVSLFFPPDTGYRLLSVTDNGESVFTRRGRVIIIPPYSATFTENHSLVVKYEIDSPVGTFPLAYNPNSPTSVAIADVTGNYGGKIPGKPNLYSMTVTMDESGKVMALGTVKGFVNKKTGDGSVKGKGAVKTINGLPTTTGNAGIEGTLDGKVIKGSGKANIPVQVTTTMSGPIVPGIVASGNAVQDGAAFNQPPGTFTAPAQPANVSKNLSINLELKEVTDAKGRTSVTAEATVIMPTDQKTKFAAKRVKYSLAKGYTVAFSGGRVLDMSNNPTTVDKKTTLLISNLKFTKNGDDFVPNGGLLKYRLLGQKGQGYVTDFLVP
jgi:hypothetical protein